MLVAYYCPEKLSSIAEQEIIKSSIPLIITNLTEVEFYSSISKKLRNSENPLTKTQATEFINKFRRHQKERYYERISLEEKHYSLAKQWLEKLNVKLPLTTLDALHLSFVESKQMFLITSDIKLSNSAKILGIKHKLISENNS